MYKGRFISAPIPLLVSGKAVGPGKTGGTGKPGFDRADIEIHGIDQSGASFEGRVFLNNPDATLHTPLTAEQGYAGSFHVFGYGVWPADVGKDNTALAESAEVIRAPISKTVIATEAVRRAARQGETVRITIVPVYPGHPLRDASDAFKLEDVTIIFHGTQTSGGRR
jgi:hypothetical protein